MINETTINNYILEIGGTEILAEQYVAGQEGYKNGGYEGGFKKDEKEYIFSVSPEFSDLSVVTELDDYGPVQGPILHVYPNGRPTELTFKVLLDLATKLDFWSIPATF